MAQGDYHAYGSTVDHSFSHRVRADPGTAAGWDCVMDVRRTFCERPAMNGAFLLVPTNRFAHRINEYETRHPLIR